MTRPEARGASQRKADTLAQLRGSEVDAWVASASVAPDGSPRAHLIPLSLAWVDERVVIALEGTSVTARSITATGQARLALGPTRDVVVIDAVLDRAISAAELPADLGDRYAAQAGWDPRTAGPSYVYLVLRPHRVQAWREANEIPGRTLMRDGTWLV